jgi:hypothetical protein
MALLAGVALLYGFHSTRPAGPPANAVPVVVLMDTSAPMGVYDPRTRENSGTNADDISDALRDLPVALHKETVGATWNREDQVLKQIPDLIIIHRSAFIHAIVLDFQLGYPAPGDPRASSKEGPPPSREVLYDRLGPIGQGKLDAFLGYVGGANPRTRFLIYSRVWAEAARLQWEQSLERRFPAMKGRVFPISKAITNGTASFRDPDTVAQVTHAVRSILGLTASGAKK